MSGRRTVTHGLTWLWLCLGLMALAGVGFVASLAGLGRLGVDGSFTLSALSLLALLAGIAGLQWGAMLDVLRSSEPPETRLLYVGLIILLVPVGAILYYWLRGRSATSPQSSSFD